MKEKHPSLVSLLDMPVQKTLNQEDIKHNIPHREPFLLVDEVTSALDRESQYQIEKFLLSLPCCVVHISHHNLEQFSNRYDEIITLQRV